MVWLAVTVHITKWLVVEFWVAPSIGKLKAAAVGGRGVIVQGLDLGWAVGGGCLGDT